MNCGTSDELCGAPDACANVEDSREQHLLSQSTNPTDSRILQEVKRDKTLLIAIVAMIVLLNIPYLKFIIYPFMIFSTWIHEMCHGLAAFLVGGSIKVLYIYHDGSGLATTYTSGENWKKAFVASGGYMGTALTGSIMLLFRRTRRGPTIGLIGIGCFMILSCALYVRNAFGITIIIALGVAIIACAWKLKSKHVGYSYSFISANVSFNALEGISDLFAPGKGYVNGEARYSDAHSVAKYIGMSYIFWASLWLIFACVMSLIGLVFVFDGLTYKEHQKQSQTYGEGHAIAVF